AALVGFAKVSRSRAGMSVVRGRRSGGAKVGPAAPMCGEVAVPAGDILAADLAEAAERGGEMLMFGVDHRVRTIGGDHAAVPAGLSDGAMMLQAVVRAFRRRQQLDVEPLEQGARPKVGLSQCRIDPLV